MKQIKIATKKMLPFFLLFAFIFSSGIMVALVEGVVANNGDPTTGPLPGHCVKIEFDGDEVDEIENENYWNYEENDSLVLTKGEGEIEIKLDNYAYDDSNFVGFDWNILNPSNVTADVWVKHGDTSGKYDSGQGGTISVSVPETETGQSGHYSKKAISNIVFCIDEENGNNGNGETNDTVTIKGYKVVCDDEGKLPNWVTHRDDPYYSGNPLTETDILAYEYLGDGCWLADDWYFEWAEDGTSKLDGDVIGTAKDNSRDDWNKFGPTEDGVATIEIDLEDRSKIWIREVLQEGYIRFAHPQDGWEDTDPMESAELICHTDGWKYDNYNSVDGLEAGGEYYCVAFNAPKTTDVEVCKEDYDEEEKLGGWEISLDYKKTDLSFKDTTDDEKGDNYGCVIFEDVPYGEYELSETLQDGWENVSGLGDVTVDGENNEFTIVNREKKEITINAYKVICEDESDLPNWAREENDPFKEGSELTKEKIKDRIEGTSCEFVKDWYFQWGDENATKMPGNHFGEGDDTWTTFGPTDEDGRATVTLPYKEGVNHFWVREVLKQGYLPFSDSEDGNTSVSAEMLCHIDGYKYDNYDRVDSPEEGEEYTCVAFNVPVVTLKAHKVVCEDEDYLPNWVRDADYPYYSGNPLQKEDIVKFVDDHEGCWFESNWEFEWGYDGYAQKVDGDHFGKAEYADKSGWHDFDTVTGEGCNPAIATIMDLNPSNKIWVREVLQDGYLPFAYPQEGWDTGEKMVSAELICHADGWKYDNYDYVENAEKGKYYYCVAFNVSEEEKECEDIVVVSNEEDRVYDTEGEFLKKATILERIHGAWKAAINGIAEWIWKVEPEDNDTSENDATYIFKKEFNVYGSASSAALQVAADNSYKVWINDCFEKGSPAEDNYSEKETYGVPESCLKDTGNVIKFKVENHPQAVGPWKDNPAGLLYRLDIERDTCYEPTDVTVCKTDGQENKLEGWHVALVSSESVYGPTAINVMDDKGTDSSNLDEGYYLIKVSGTYRYGSSTMIADAGYSYRPANIPDGCDCWYSGFDLSSGSDGLMAWINGEAVYWGPLDEDYHTYTTIYYHENDGEEVNISIWDNYYDDNYNDDSFVFEIFPIEYQGITESDGCVTFSSVPHGYYLLEEENKMGWENESGLGEVEVTEGQEEFTIVNIGEPETDTATIKAHKVICNDEGDLPNWVKDREYPSPTVYLTEQSVIDYVNGSEGACRFTEEEWQFEWGYDGQVEKEKGDHTCLADGENWHSFANSALETDPALATVNLEEGRKIWVREVLKDGYLPFSDHPGNGVSSESAELICHADGFNYDNYEYVDEMEANEEYICVAFNVLEEVLHTVTFKDRGDVVTKSAGHGNSLGEDGMPKEPTKEGYNFKGWNTAPEGEGESFDSSKEITGDITVYAIWEQDSGTRGRSSSGQSFAFIPSAAPEGDVLGEGDEREEEEVDEDCEKYLFEHLRYGQNNNPDEVRKLQIFLNEHMGESLTVDGFFGKETERAVNRFQEEYSDEVLEPWGIDEPTGYVYLTTKRWINMIKCPLLGIPMPDLSGHMRRLFSPEVVTASADGEVLGGEDERRDWTEEDFVEDVEEEDEDVVDEDVGEEVVEEEEEEEEEEGRTTAIVVLVTALAMLGGTLFYIFKPVA